MPLPLKAAPGQTLEGRFLLVEEIGHGAMATVFRAQDLQNGGQPVAVKVPLPQYASGVGSWSMMQREAEIGLALRHPSIARFVALESNKRGLVVTEFVQGRPLSAHVGKGRALSEKEALDVAARICDAVAYLHGRGFVHYDLKPSNVMVCDDGSLRLIDFGLAHAIVRGRFAFGGPGPAMATAEYAAPEQIARRRGQTSVDVYAIGAMLYEMLTGHPPFENDDPFVVASARQIGDPKAPRALNSAISVQAEEIALRALRRNPGERYETATALKNDVEHPERLEVTGLAARLVEVTPWRKLRRVARQVLVVAILPLASQVVLFLLLLWYFKHKH